MKNKFTINCIIILTLALPPTISISQNEFQFVKNPSFEDTPRMGSKRSFIKGWFDCGTLEFSENSAPDIHGAETNFWNVKHSPSEGHSYLGLTVREDNSWEGVSQELIKPLSKDSCYHFTIDLCKSSSYQSGLKGGGKQLFEFDNSVVLIISGGPSYCSPLEVLYKSPSVNNEEWQSYEVNFQPKIDIKYIKLQAYYTDGLNPYNGNILIDNISKFTMTNCIE